MKKLQLLLDRFLNITPPNHAVRNAVVDVVRVKINIVLDRSDISVREGVVYIKARPIIKSEILLRKKEILDGVKNKIGSAAAVVDVR